MKRRIIICLLLLLVVYLTGGVSAVLWLDRSVDQLSAVAESHRIQSMREVLVSAGVRVERDFLAYLAEHEDEHGLEARADSERRLDKSLRRCGGCHHEPPIKSRLDAIRETFEIYQAAAMRLFAEGNASNRSDLEEEVLTLSNRLVTQTTEAADLADRHLVVRSADVAASVQRAQMLLSGTLVATLVFGGTVALHLKRRLTKPVEALLEGIERVRAGDLSYRFPIHADEEFRLLGAAFNRAYEDLKSAQEHVLQAEKLAAVGKLAAGVAHEVLNPLASISSIAQMMRRHCESDEAAKQIDLIMEQVSRVSVVLRELLTFSRPAAAEKHTLVAVGPLLERAATLSGYDRRARKIKIDVSCDRDLRPVTGDSERLLIVFTNIMMNALDALSSHGDGSGTITITARQKADRVALEFVDNGPGMTDEQIAHAVEPFFTTKAPGAGTGLGLWICYQVLQRHKGSIRIDSLPGERTTVAVELPCSGEND